jgi:phage FluMu protein Com
MSDVAGRNFETRFEEIDVVCPRCQTTWQPAIARFVNVRTHPDARLGLLLNKMHHSNCPRCKSPKFIETNFEYYDPDHQLLVQIRPEWQIRAGGGEDYYLECFEQLVNKYADVDVRVDVVFGYQEIIERHLGGDDAVAEAHAEWDRRVAEARERRQREVAARRPDRAHTAETAQESTDDEKPVAG